MTNQAPTFRRRQSGNLIGQIQQLILHPVTFFRSLPPMADTRQWLWAALLIGILVGASAVQVETRLLAAESFEDVVIPIDEQLIIGLTGAAKIFIAWVGLTILLAPLSMLRGFAPRFGQSLQIAIWSSIPFGLMAVVQLLYMASGGELGAVGLTGILYTSLGFTDLPQFTQFLLLRTAEHLTLFGFWNLILVYFGARHTLQSNRWLALLFMLLWVAAVILLPTALDIIQAGPPEVAPAGFTLK